MQVLKNTVPKSMWDTKSLNSSALNQVCVSAKMEEQLPSMPVSSCPKDSRCYYYNGTVEAFIKAGRSYQGTYQFFLKIFPEINNLANENLRLHVFNVFPESIFYSESPLRRNNARLFFWKCH